MKKISLLFAVFMLIEPINSCSQKSGELTQEEKADIQYQLFLMSEKATHEAVKVKYEYGTDVVENILLKESYKNICNLFEGVTAPTSDVDFVEFIKYGTKTDNKVEVTIDFETQGNSYTIVGNYDFRSHSFDNANDIFMYMCLTKEEAVEYDGEIINSYSWNI